MSDAEIKLGHRQMMAKKLDFIERGGRTMRCHTVPTLKTQSVGEHSFGVAWLCWLLSGEEPSARLLMAALQHDLAEHETGDLPAPTKKELKIESAVKDWEGRILSHAMIGHFALTAEEKRVLTIADSLELMMYCVRERAFGNRSKQIFEMFSKVHAYATEQTKTQYEKDAVQVILENWRSL